MIATLFGVVSEKLADVVVLDVHGVGYGLLVTTDDYSKLVTAEPTKLYIYEHIREQSHDLFGFLTRDTKALFELLLDVNGVGPKMALNVLSIGTSQAVRQAIAGGDVKFIQQANGVGKKVAETKPTHMSVEKLFFAQNVTTAMTVAQARGVVLLCGMQAGLTIFEYTPLQIKQAVTGYGRAEKTQIQEMVRVILQLKEIPKPDDAADALAAAITHSMTLRM